MGTREQRRLSLAQAIVGKKEAEAARAKAKAELVDLREDQKRLEKKAREGVKEAKSDLRQCLNRLAHISQAEAELLVEFVDETVRDRATKAGQDHRRCLSTQQARARDIARATSNFDRRRNNKSRNVDAEALRQEGDTITYLEGLHAEAANATEAAKVELVSAERAQARALVKASSLESAEAAPATATAEAGTDAGD